MFTGGKASTLEDGGSSVDEVLIVADQDLSSTISGDDNVVIHASTEEASGLEEVANDLSGADDGS
ncbi:hypothetical protein [Halococcus dombrowskii]|uniref:hypothetical protein n=1 Tax=Halococcus dombrowskii TaxID=179637 RepID=UPI0031D203FD